MDEQPKAAPPTLTDDDIVAVERPNRRSALSAIGAAVAAVFGATVLKTSEAEAQCTDSDSGYGADGAGRGRRCRGVQSGCTDSDSGPGADGAGLRTSATR